MKKIFKSLFSLLILTSISLSAPYYISSPKYKYNFSVDTLLYDGSAGISFSFSQVNLWGEFGLSVGSFKDNIYLDLSYRRYIVDTPLLRYGIAFGASYLDKKMNSHIGAAFQTNLLYNVYIYAEPGLMINSDSTKGYVKISLESTF